MHFPSFITTLSLLHTATSQYLHLKKPLDIGSPQAAPSDAHTGPVEIIQVYKPLTISSKTKCNVQKTLMRHTFANSYNDPFVGEYVPPQCDFNRVTIEWAVTSAGRQFDRLAHMFLGDSEVWRTSTAEPIQSGILFRYQKDLSMYLSLWKSRQHLIFSLNNVYDNTYTGAFNTTLTATFSYDPTQPDHADLILPISPLLSHNHQPSIFTLPSQDATVKQKIPLNVTRAIVSIGATGQGNEEFWYANALESDKHTFESTVGPMPGYGSFREVQLWIDGMLAGVAWPFPIIFTGGIVPGLWKPVVGIDAYDLREDEIDITPFLPYLLDGKSHAFSIKVVGMSNNGGNGTATLSEKSVNDFWLVSGKIFLFTSSEGNYNGTHTPPIITTNPLITTTSHTTTTRNNKNDTTLNDTLTANVIAKRSYTAKSSSGTWLQALSYSNDALFSSLGYLQETIQSTDGFSSYLPSPNTSTSNNLSSHVLTFSYPLTISTAYDLTDPNNITIAAAVDRGLEITSSGRKDLSTYTLSAGPVELGTLQVGGGLYERWKGGSRSEGQMVQVFNETSGGTTWTRRVRTDGLRLVEDGKE